MTAVKRTPFALLIEIPNLSFAASNGAGAATEPKSRTRSRVRLKMMRDGRGGTPPFTSGPHTAAHSGSAQSMRPSGSLSIRSLQISAKRHVDVQSSLLFRLPSSHSSPHSISPLPQVSDTPLHWPPSQASPPVQLWPSSQAMPFGAMTSAGQFLETPSQVSGTSHESRAGRHTAPVLPAVCAHWPFRHVSRVHGLPSSSQKVPFGWSWFDGQASWTPSQNSATSQEFAGGRHSVVLLASAGQVTDVPVQNSATSQTPAAARHVDTAGRYPSAGHDGVTPSQVSAMSHGPAIGRQTCPAAVAPAPVQVPATHVEDDEQMSPSLQTVPFGFS